MKKTSKNPRTVLKHIWNFFWHNDSIWSWIVNIIIAFILIKFVIYPFLGVFFGTAFPIVAVISESMEHGPSEQILCGKEFTDFKDSFNNYWSVCGNWYEENNLFPEQFRKFSFPNGFNKGDLIIIWGTKPKNLNMGDVIIFQGSKQQPIIHRITNKWLENNHYFFQTKGDHNKARITGFLGETKINEQRILGKGLLRIPYLGWIKILFVQAVKPLGWTITT